jgi:hypothetical protein
MQANTGGETISPGMSAARIAGSEGAQKETKSVSYSLELDHAAMGGLAFEPLLPP